MHWRQLASQYGKDNVGAENASGIGTRIDVLVRRGKRILVLRDQDCAVATCMPAPGGRPTARIRVLAWRTGRRSPNSCRGSRDRQRRSGVPTSPQRTLLAAD